MSQRPAPPPWRRLVLGAVLVVAGIAVLVVGVALSKSHPGASLLVEGAGGLVTLAGLVAFTITINRAVVARYEAEARELRVVEDGEDRDEQEIGEGADAHDGDPGKTG